MYILTWSLETFYVLPNFLVLIVDTLELLHAFNCSAPASWIQGPSFSVCFKSVASFCHPQFLSRTSPLSINCARNSRIRHFYLNITHFRLGEISEISFLRLWGLIEKLTATISSMFGEDVQTRACGMSHVNTSCNVMGSITLIMAHMNVTCVCL